MTAGPLSFWAWGYESKIPAEDARTGIAAHVAGVLGVAPPSPRPLPTLDAIELPAPAVEVPEKLKGFCSADKQDRVLHTYGKSFRDQVRAFQGDFSPAPDFVAYPADEEEISAVLGWASRSSVAVIPFGGGTSVVGGWRAGRVEVRGAISLDLRKLDKVLEVDSVSRAARSGGGAGPLSSRGSCLMG
ncbi:MAG: FAD-dependent oxidoreductase [Polyangiaceae bacterium]